MRTTGVPLAAALAGLLLLTACGSQVAGANGNVSRQSPDACTDAGTADGSSASSGGSDQQGPGDVRIARCELDPLSVVFEVTNHQAEPFTFTFSFSVLSIAGEALSDGTQTVASVGAGRTVQQTVDLKDPSYGPRAAGVRVTKVRGVPADEAPAPAGPCPPSGVRVTVGPADAAMGLRVVDLRLVNCSTRDYHVSGYPQLQLFDAAWKSVTGVRISHGSGGITTGTDFDAPPRPMTLKPGESASSGLMWRNTLTDGTALDVPYVRVVARPGAPVVAVTPELDLGTTGKLAVRPWTRDENTAPAR